MINNVLTVEFCNRFILISKHEAKCELLSIHFRGTYARKTETTNASVVSLK